MYRGDAHDQYGHAEVRLRDALAPHLFEALRINRTIGFREHVHETDLTDTAAIARTDGVLNYCGRGFLELLRREWPSWQGFLRGEQRSPLRTLTPRECTAATLYAEGRSYKEIARDMGISPATVRNFLQHTYSKLHVRDKAELAGILLRGG